MPAADPHANRLAEFVHWTRQLRGDEKSESQTFLNRLFHAFGHTDLQASGIELEKRLKFKTGGTKFADLVWPGRVLIEMKTRGERLDRHYRQAFDYWTYLTPTRPRWVILCNFDELWIYDFDRQVDEPMEKVPVAELAARSAALAFLKPKAETPVFGVNRIHVTQEAADSVAGAFNAMLARGIPREQAQRFVLQCVVAKFSEDLGLLPKTFFTRILREALDSADPADTAYTLIDGLFRQMNTPKPAAAGRFRDIRYFNGGLFATVEPVAMTRDELEKLYAAAEQDWTRVNPAIFGTLFQHSMGKAARHAFGAHYTAEADILKVVNPTIVHPWRERIEAAKTAAELVALHKELQTFRVLDPACGSGNFLYVAFREMKRLETDLLLRLRAKKGKHRSAGFLSPKQFFGFDVLDFAVELAKVTLLLAKELALVEARDALALDGEDDAELELDSALPLDNLGDNIRCSDALFTPWPAADAIVGNPPYLDARKFTMEHGAAYAKKVRAKFKEVPGRADLCVYWFRHAHDCLPSSGRAGLVGTNTIRQNYSREGGLDYIVSNGGTITDAVSSQVWNGDAAVHVSIVNWIKGESSGLKRLSTQLGDTVESPWASVALDHIPSSLSDKQDVAAARILKANDNPKACFEGQQPGHTGFILNQEQSSRIQADDPSWREVLFPRLNGDDLLSDGARLAPKWIIDFGEADSFGAQRHRAAYAHIESTVLEDWNANAAKELKETGKATGEHQNRLKTWWLLKRRRGELIARIEKLPRYIVCSRVTKRPIFAFLASEFRPDTALTVFPFADDYTFGILQSAFHWEWFKARCSTLEERFRYTSDTVFDSFPWPQSPDTKAVRAVADAARALRETRARIMTANGWSLRDLYRAAEKPGRNPLTDAQTALDRAVATAYGLPAKNAPDILAFLLDLNATLATRESSGLPVTAPGLPPGTPNPESFVTTDCIRPL